MTPGPIPSGMTRSLRRALGSIAAGALLLGVMQIVISRDGLAPGSALLAAVFWLYIAVGLLVWQRRPSNAMGFLIVLGGFSLALSNFTAASVPALVFLGAAFDTSVLAVTVHLLLAFPAGRLRTWPARLTTAAGYVVSLVLQIPLYLIGDDRVAPVDPEYAAIAGIAVEVQSSAGLAVMVAAAAIMVRRFRRAGPPLRKVIAPLYGYGAAAVLLLPLSSRVGGGIGASPAAIFVAQLALLTGVPIVIAFILFTGRFARTGAVAELASRLGTTTDGGRPALTGALASTLGDPSLRILFRDADDRGYLDADGEAAEVPDAASGRTLSEVRVDGRLVGALEYDSVLVDDAEMVKTAGRIVALSVDRDRLTAELLAAQHELRRSRTRLVHAADRERRRIAMDLHDGVQARLVLLGVHAQHLADGRLPPAAREQAVALREQIDGTAADVRNLVHGVMPSALIERGLAAAIEDLVDRLPMPVALEAGVPDGSVPAPVESVAYFVVAEGLSNAVKHADARRATVRLRREADMLVIEVIDDGSGGATPGDGGSGLRGLADRVDSVGGTLRVHSEPGAGTRLRAELPCGS